MESFFRSSCKKKEKFVKMNSLVLACIVCVTTVTAWVQEMENPGLYEGDMVLSPKELEQAVNGTFFFSSLKDLSKRWPNDRVPYRLDYTLSGSSKARAAIQAAIADYHRYTCIRFHERTNEREYIEFYKGGGCSSPVGFRKYNKNRVSLASGCWSKSTAMHEIGHSLGLHHEQTRPDRDSFVRLETSNIHSDMMFNFHRQPASKINSYNTPYDYLSMMHYSWNAFAVNRDRPSITTLNSMYQYHIGQDYGLSQIDAQQLNAMYSCPTPSETPPYYRVVPGCYNQGGGCQKLADEGNCNVRSWKTYMHGKCRMACKLCDGGVTTGGGPNPNTPKPYTPNPNTPKPNPITPKPNPQNCYDKHSNCYTISKRECGKWPDYFKRNCKKWCQYC